MDTLLPAGISGSLDSGWRATFWLGYRLLKIWWFVWRPRHAGAVVAVWLDGRILLVRQSYRKTLSWPGGGIRRSETPKDAARRELREEIGLSVEREALSFAMDMVLPLDYRRDHVNIFELVLKAPPVLRLDNREVVEASFLDPDTVLKRPIQPFIRAYLLRERLQSPATPAVLRETSKRSSR